MLFGEPPFYGYSVDLLIQDIQKKSKNFNFPRNISNESKDIIVRLL